MPTPISASALAFPGHNVCRKKVTKQIHVGHIGHHHRKAVWTGAVGTASVGVQKLPRAASVLTADRFAQIMPGTCRGGADSHAAQRSQGKESTQLTQTEILLGKHPPAAFSDLQDKVSRLMALVH